MAKPPNHLLIFLFTLLLSAFFIQGLATQVAPQRQSASIDKHFKGGNSQGSRIRDSRRLLIGSTAPTCTYNECRGCKFKCRAEQIPVDANDPINSAYHYRCVCHR
ncbi:Epidermal patterning factor-like protein [Thalictrum thalictroides]|uniref:Epidermal patterning factor-like protein n=1 Tax=Thalictrum thalictroides TaxID=46969 RepID=A0A7J6VRN1_THATH|nr:Epidermal patterning factor-like protein [Thalictrum thalictroides]